MVLGRTEPLGRPSIVHSVVYDQVCILIAFHGALDVVFQGALWTLYFQLLVFSSAGSVMGFIERRVHLCGCRQHEVIWVYIIVLVGFEWLQLRRPVGRPSVLVEARVFFLIFLLSFDQSLSYFSPCPLQLLLLFHKLIVGPVGGKHRQEIELNRVEVYVFLAVQQQLVLRYPLLVHLDLGVRYLQRLERLLGLLRLEDLNMLLCVGCLRVTFDADRRRLLRELWHADHSVLELWGLLIQQGCGRGRGDVGLRQVLSRCPFIKLVSARRNDGVRCRLDEEVVRKSFLPDDFDL